jgi:hypothetical protein
LRATSLYIYIIWSQDIAVNILSRLQTERCRVLNPEEVGEFSPEYADLLQSPAIQRASGSHISLGQSSRGVKMPVIMMHISFEILAVYIF